MSKTYILTPKADEDLVVIWLYTRETWGLDQANKYLNELEDQFHRLVEKPDLGKKCNNIRTGYRYFHIKHHLVIYRNLNKQLEIVRILHERMNIPNHF